MAIYKRGGKIVEDKNGKKKRVGGVCWYEFSFHGRRIRESSRQGDVQVAKELMAARRTQLARIKAGLESAEPHLQTDADITISQLLDGLINDYKLRRKHSNRTASHIKRARKDFGALNARNLTRERVDEYIEHRLKSGAAPASINRVTQLLGQAYKVAIARKQVTAAPAIRRLSEKGNARSGFFSEHEFRTVQRHLPADLQDFALFGYLTGWRKSEIASLRWEDVQDGVVRLRGENSKNREPRAVVLQGELAKLIDRRKQARAVEAGEHTALAEHVFHRDGEPVREFRKSWATACVAAGLGKTVCPKCGSKGLSKWCKPCQKTTEYHGKLFHDLRRTAVRNMIRANVPERVAMSISGHRTRSVFDRYNIVNEQDLRNAMVSVDGYLKAAKEKVITMEASR